MRKVQLRGVSIDERRIRETVAQQSAAAYANSDVDQAALEQVTRHVNENRFTFDSILASELPLRSDEGDYRLTGRADMISEKTGALVITDFKTGDRAATTPHQQVEFKQQLSLYAHMAEQRLGRPVSQTRIYWTSEANLEAASEYVDVDADRVAAARQQSALTAESIRSGDFTVRDHPPEGVCHSGALLTVCRRDGTIDRT